MAGSGLAEVGPDQQAETCESLRTAIQDTQETIRAFDIKSEFLAAFLALIVGVRQWTPLSVRGYRRVVSALAGMSVSH